MTTGGGERLLPSEMSRAIPDRIAGCGRDAVIAPAQGDGVRRLPCRAGGREPRMRTDTDAAPVGAMMGTVGSRRIDTSIRGRRARLRNAMREVG